MSLWLRSAGASYDWQGDFAGGAAGAAGGGGGEGVGAPIVGGTTTPPLWSLLPPSGGENFDSARAERLRFAGGYGAPVAFDAMAARHGGNFGARCRKAVARSCRLLALVFLVAVLVLMVRNWLNFSASPGGGGLSRAPPAPTDKAASATHHQLQLGVYYEALCPDSKRLICDQLRPLMSAAPAAVSLLLVPYGKSRTFGSGESAAFVCQHGETECWGNKLHACAIDTAASQQQQQQTLSLVYCLMRNFYKLRQRAPDCAKSAGVSWSRLAECANSTTINPLMEQYGNWTHALLPPLTFVPTVTVDGSQDDQIDLQNDLLSTVCRLFQKKFGYQAEGCV